VAVDVAGNVSENYPCAVHFELNDFISELNVPALVTGTPLDLNLAGTEYNGPYVVSLDGSSGDTNAAVALPLGAGEHTLCVFVKGHNDINRCTDFNVDLAPPTAAISAPSTTRSRRVRVSWSTSDDFRVASVQLVVDGSVENVSPSGSKTLTLPYGSHSICLRATDAAGRTTEKCTSVVVRHPHYGGGGFAPSFPRDALDRQFKMEHCLRVLPWGC